jgi:hypothetical protein
MSYRQQQTNYGSKVVTGADQKVQLMSWLYSCRVKMLDAAVLEDVQRRYSKVPRQVVEYELICARQRRAGEDRL